MARHGRDEAGNIWELDAQGNPVRMIQPAQAPPSVPGALAIPPNPRIAAEKQAEAARQAAAESRAERSDQRAAAAEARAQKKFESEDTMAPPPGDTTKTGEEYLATLPKALAGQARALIEGRRAFPTGSALRSPAVQQLIAAATQADPTLDATNSFTRVATRKEFTSGTTRENITAINTALGHLGRFGRMPRNSTTSLASSSGTHRSMQPKGIRRSPRYTTSTSPVRPSLTSLRRPSVGPAGLRRHRAVEAGINNSQSPEQLRGAIEKAVELLQSRLEALASQLTGHGPFV
jgi:hypothetical protein